MHPIRRVARVVPAALALIGSCGDGSPACAPAPPDAVQVCMELPDDAESTGPAGSGVEGTLIADGRRISGLYAGSEWRQDGLFGGEVAHGDPALPRMSDVSFVDVVPGEQILLTGDANTVGVRLGPIEEDREGLVRFGRAVPLRVVQDSVTIEAEPGDYMLSVTGTWDDGTQGFWFGVRVV